MMFKLRSINRVLRWTGWRLAVEVDCENVVKNKGKPWHESSYEPTRIGLIWYGWGFVRHLDTDLKDRK